jgi:hypothetical protein
MRESPMKSGRLAIRIYPSASTGAAPMKKPGIAGLS